MLRLLKNLNYYSIEPHLRSIKASGIQASKVQFNPNIPQIYTDTFLKKSPIDIYTQKSFVSLNGALCAYSGKNTERQIKNSRVVRDKNTEKTVQWNELNIQMTTQTYDLVEKIAVDYINHVPKLYLIDGYIGYDPNYRLKVRSYCTRAYHALFLRNMLVRPTKTEMEEDFTSGVDITLFNGGEMNLPKLITRTDGDSISAINLSQQKITILGTQFAGQMKKSLFKLSSYIFPKKHVLPLRASAFINQSDKSCVLIGLPGSGKGSLVMRARKNHLISTDQIGWTPSGIENLEGGVYARILNLKSKLEDQVYKAIKFGAVVQNANSNETNRQINFYDASVTQNARICYPLQNLNFFKYPPTAQHPNNLIFLTCDLQGVLPPVAKLTKQQALFFYLSGYSAKLNKKLIDPKNEFSTCFSGETSTHHPELYLELLRKRIETSKAKIWLINTGWINGKFGDGKRMQIDDSTLILDAINRGELQSSQTYSLPHFRYEVPTNVKGMDQKLLHPSDRWRNKHDYQQSLKNLAQRFVQNYQQKFQGKVKMDISSGIPCL